MKKLLALLLALLLPACSFAESLSVTVKINDDEQSFPAYALELMQKIPGQKLEESRTTVQIMQSIFKDMKLVTVVQPEALSVEALVSGNPLLDMSICREEEMIFLTSSMMPGYALAEKLIPVSDGDETTESAIQRNGLITSIQAAFSAWSKDITPVATYGAFQGDAYSGGSKCKTWSFTDQDVAALVSSLATKEVREAFTLILKMLGEDAAALFQQFDELNDRVADEDHYTYLLRVVEDDQDQFVGASLSCLKENQQTATISLGFQNKILRIVFGLGMKTSNYWWEYEIRMNRKDNLIYLRGLSSEWIADKSESFAYVRETNAPVFIYNWNCNINKTGSRYLWDAVCYEGDTAVAMSELAACRGSYVPLSKAMDATLSFKWGQSTPLKIQIAVKEADELPAIGSDVKLCSVQAEEDAELFKTLNQNFAFEFASRMLNILPLDVILDMGDWLE